MKRIELFQKALNMSKEKYAKNVDYFVLKAIIFQLEYLIDIISSNGHDLSKLKTITIGRIVAYDIENWDPQLADILYLAAEEARMMTLEYEC